MSTLHLRIYGRVQGVGFRDAMCRKARRLGIGGWVRNCTAGTVEAVVSGDDAAVLAMLDWSRKGPPLARVDNVDQEVATGHYSSFTMLPTE